MRHSTIGETDLHLFNEGTHRHLYGKLGATIVPGGVHFAVWAPNAEAVGVFGDWNGWTKPGDALHPRGGSGIWEGFVPKLGKGTCYKYWIRSRVGGHSAEKADPFALLAETPPKTASIVWDLDHAWGDREWMKRRGKRIALDAPVSIYELHLGSWRRGPDGQHLGYREIAEPLARWVKEHGFTHVELMPVMEHPFYGSWGYQVTSYFAPTHRYGKPQDLMALIDHLHQNGIGVILDWVPSHFPADAHGLAFFDGTHLYEHADPRKGYHPDWKSSIFNYGRNEVRSFLLSSAIFWLDKYHADGLRVDGVASMLYLDYSRKAGEWIPNRFGGRENLEAVSFLQRMNEDVYAAFPDVQVIAEESTAWPNVTRPTYIGGLGFGLKWDMGWMHDTLQYLALDPVFRKYHHADLTFRGLYAWSENYVLALSHDEVVHGKGSLLGKMSGDWWQKLANLRLLFGAMFAQPGKKLVFMGGELGEWREWNHESELDWGLVGQASHDGLRRWVSDLNRVYRGEPAMHVLDTQPGGFEWIHADDFDHSVISFMRWAPDRRSMIVCVFNFTPVVRSGYRVGTPIAGTYEELLNSDAAEYGGSGVGNLSRVTTEPVRAHGRPSSLSLTLPPLGVLFLKSPVS